MYTFINNAEMVVCISTAKVRHEKKERYVGDARRNRDGTAVAEPISVCGRVNRHKTAGKLVDRVGSDRDSASQDSLSLFTLLSVFTSLMSGSSSGGSVSTASFGMLRV